MRCATPRPLRTYLALLLFLATTVPIAATALFTYRHLSAATVDDVKRRNLDRARSVAGEVTAFLRTSRYVLTGIRQALLLSHGPDAVLTVHLPETDPGQRPEQNLFESIYLLGADGRVTAMSRRTDDSRPDLLGLDLALEPLFRQTLRRGEPTWSETFQSAISGHMSLALAIPVDASVVLVGNLNLELLQPVISRTGAANQPRVALVDRSGAVVAHTDSEVTAWRANVGHLPLVREALAGTVSTREYALGEEVQLGSAAPIPGPGWVALVSQSAATVVAPLSHTARMVAATGVAALVAALYLAFGLARRVAAPLAQLTEQARRAAAGEFQFPRVQGPFREVETLGRTFSEMLTALGTREHQLVESERRYRELADLLPQVVYEVDRRGSVTYSNRFGFSLFGIEPEALAEGLPVLQLLAPEDRQRAKENLRRRFQGEAITDNEYRILTADGREIPALIYSAPIIQDGDVQGVRGVMIDITERKATEEALRFTQFALDHLSDAVFFLRRDGGFTYVNNAACDSLGYTREELLALDAYAIDPDLHTSAWHEHWQQMQATGTWNTTTRHRSRDGTTREVEVSMSPVEFGGEAYICAVVRDLTERRALEEQLRQSQKLEAVGTLASGIAHDFNNLLQAISGYTELLLADTVNTKNRQRLKQVAAAAASAAELVQQILTFSRRRALDRRPIDLNREVRQAVGMLRRTLPKMIHIEEHLDPDLWHLSADATQVEQVLMNLGTNARDAMPDGGRLTLVTRNRTLGVGEHPRLAPGPYVELTVADDGCGMDQETQARIFEPFFTTKGVGKGTGLGLSTAYGIVRAHGGHLHCSSAPGAGTTFTINLPARPEAEPARRPEAESPTAAPNGEEHVLLVDDEEMVLELARGALEACGYRVSEARRGEEALGLYRAALASVDNGNPAPFAAVVLDLGMPGMGGQRCLEQLVRLDSGARILVASGYAEPTLRSDLLAAGARGFISKPYQLRELCDELRDVLDGPRNRTSVA